MHRTADIQLALAYDCIEQAKLERLNFLTSEPLLLIDRSKPNEYSNSITNNNKIVSLTPSKSTPQSLNILNHEDTYEDYYEDEEFDARAVFGDVTSATHTTHKFIARTFES